MQGEELRKWAIAVVTELQRHADKCDTCKQLLEGDISKAIMESRSGRVELK